MLLPNHRFRHVARVGVNVNVIVIVTALIINVVQNANVPAGINANVIVILIALIINVVQNASVLADVLTKASLIKNADAKKAAK